MYVHACVQSQAETKWQQARGVAVRARRRGRRSDGVVISHMHSDLRSDGLTEWKAPDAMKSMWLVFTLPCLVETVQPDDVEMVTSS